jgi:hypothetical protein
LSKVVVFVVGGDFDKDFRGQFMCPNKWFNGKHMIYLTKTQARKFLTEKGLKELGE